MPVIPVGGVGSSFGIERCLDGAANTAKPFDHVFDHVIGADQQRLACQLRREVAIAQVPGDADQGRSVGSFDGEQALRHSLYRDQRLVLQPQPVAIPEVNHLRLIEEDRASGLRLMHDAATTALFVIEPHDVSGP